MGFWLTKGSRAPLIQLDSFAISRLSRMVERVRVVARTMRVTRVVAASKTGLV